jgi:hypothetical protein
MIFAILLALIAIASGYYIHKQFSPSSSTHEASIGDGKAQGSKREKIAASSSKREAVVPGLVSNRSVYNTAANETSSRSVTGESGAQSLLPSTATIISNQTGATMESGDKTANVENDEVSSRDDIKTARSPTPAEIPKSFIGVATSEPPSAPMGTLPPDVDSNNNVQLVGVSEDGAAPAGKSPIANTAVIPTASERLRGELGNLPDSTARNVSPKTGSSNREVKPDPATASALSEKKKVKKRSSGAQKSPKKSKISKKSKEIKSSEGGE